MTPHAPWPAMGIINYDVSVDQVVDNYRSPSKVQLILKVSLCGSIGNRYALILILCDLVLFFMCRYGLKIRFPHSLVMTFLFQEGT